MSDLESGKKIRVLKLGGVLESQTQSAKICLNFNFRGWGWEGVLEPDLSLGVNLAIWSKISGSLACLCITDSLSHTTYVETNEYSLTTSNFLFII